MKLLTLILCLFATGASKAVTLEWVLPTEHTDGRALNVADIDKVTIYCGVDKLMDIDSPVTTTSGVGSCPNNLYSVSVTVNGVESPRLERILINDCAPPPVAYAVKPYIRNGISYDRKLYLFMADGTKTETGERVPAGTPCEGPNLGQSYVLYMQVTGRIGAAVCQEDQ